MGEARQGALSAVDLGSPEWLRLVESADMVMDDDEEAWLEAMRKRVEKRMAAVGAERMPVEKEAIAAVLVAYAGCGSIGRALRETGVGKLAFDIGLQLWADGMKVYRYLQASGARMRQMETEDLLASAVEVLRKSVSEGEVNVKAAQFLASRLDRKTYGEATEASGAKQGGREGVGGVTYSLPDFDMKVIATPQGIGVSIRGGGGAGKAAAALEREKVVEVVE